MSRSTVRLRCFAVLGGLLLASLTAPAGGQQPLGPPGCAPRSKTSGIVQTSHQRADDRDLPTFALQFQRPVPPVPPMEPAHVERLPVEHLPIDHVPVNEWQPPVGPMLPVPHVPGVVDPSAPMQSLQERITESDERVSIAVRDESIGSVLTIIAEQHGLNVVTADQVGGTISVALEDVPLDHALDAILRGNGYTWNRQNGILFVSKVSSDSQLSPFTQGRRVQVFPLNYISATDVDQVVQGLLSPLGQSFLTQTDPLDKRKTREQLVVEDLPEYLNRIEQYIAQADQPPLQVQIEAHVLQVTLKDENRHGINLNQIARMADSRLSLETTGFANSTANPALFLGVDGTDLNGILEVLKLTTDAKTLASPKVLALNGQEARIQIGSQLGFFVTTTTQTSTLQNVDFLDVGVVLRVTPIITTDGRVLMSVKPEVSGGRINPETGLPEEDTTEVETTVMLNSGQAMIVGGLIQEEDTDVQSKLPILGDLWVVGRAFQRRSTIRERSEVIIALIPHILPPDSCPAPREQVEVERVTTPLVDRTLRPLDRRAWEGELPDAMKNPRRWEPRRIPKGLRNLRKPHPLPPDYYFPTPSGGTR